jgi:anion-transporting  ArsA/GET3 family ATPase
MATHLLLRTISKVVGGAVVEDAVDFFESFEGMEQGFRERAARVEELLADESTSFVVIASPRRDSVAEATYLAERLRDSSGRVGALVINRMFPSFEPVPTMAAVSVNGQAGVWAPLVNALVRNMEDLAKVSGREEQYVGMLSEKLPGTPIVRVPFLPDDVHDATGLAAIGEWLFDPTPAEGTTGG